MIGLPYIQVLIRMAMKASNAMELLEISFFTDGR